MTKFELAPGEVIFKEANAPCTGKTLVVVPGAFPGRGVLTNQRFIHFKRNLGIGSAAATITAALLGEKIDFEFPLTTLQSLQRIDKHNLVSLTIKLTDGKAYKLINNPMFEKMDVDGWIEAFRGAVAQAGNKQLIPGADNLWTVGV